MVAWSDGSRTLIEHEGFAVVYKPAAWRFPWRNPGYVTDLVDRGVPADKFIHKGAASGAAPPPRPAAPAQTDIRTSVLLVAVVLGVLIALVGLAMIFDPGPDAARGDGALILLVSGIPSGFGIAAIARRERARA